MLAFLDDILVDIDPELVVPGVFSIQKKGEYLFLMHNNTPVLSGVRWFSMSKSGTIDPKLGKFTGKGRFRAVYANNSLDITISG